MSSRKTLQPSHVILIGASAGGLKPLRTILKTYKDLSKVSLIVLQHLDPSGKDLALEVMQKLTLAPVKLLGPSEVPKAGTLYLIPPQHYLKVEGSKIFAQLSRTKLQRLHVIDHSFKALAKGFGSRGVGVILSGEGSDGSEGVMILSKKGSCVLVQSPETCEHPSMPQHAISTGRVDEVLTPESLGRALRDLDKKELSKKPELSVEELQKEIAAALPQICEVLHKEVRHDFKNYKTSTLIRRIQRRMQVKQSESVNAYLDELSTQPKEARQLFQELLINVTSFFRDPKAFEFLSKKVLQKGLTQDGLQKYRIWVPGCSTGEEVYTLAILVREKLEKLTNPPQVQIIATDIDEEALAIARKGAYSSKIEKSVPPKFIKKYFSKQGSKYHVRKDLRELCLFSIHNLIDDPPFSQLDLISCRNVLIYLGTPLQKKIFPIFHYALKPHGYLFLGTSESFGGHRELFKIISPKHRLAQRKATAVRHPTSFSLSSYHQTNILKDMNADDPNELHLICQRIILDEYSPRYLVINEEAQVLANSQGLQFFLAPSEGAFQNSALKLVRPELRMALRTTFNESRRHKRRVTHNSSLIHGEEGILRICISVQPMPKLGENTPLYLVVFEKQERVASKTKRDPESVPKFQTDLIDHLERELAVTREDLDRTVQDLEASNEELKSSNEELLSMNEELQSANEELETSKEEVQATNEALQKSFSDLENLLSSTQIATLFLSNDLQINNFTPAIENIYRVTRNDLGRNLTDFAHQAIEMPPYPSSKKAKELRTPLMDEITLQDGRIYQRRILPYRTFDDHLDGMVVTFLDISDLKGINQRLQTMTEVIPQLIWTCLPDGRCDYLSPQWITFTGIPENEQLGVKWLEVVHPDDKDRVNKEWTGAIKGLNPYDVEYRIRRHDGEYRWFKTRGVPVRDSRGEITYWFGTSTDIDAQIKLEEKLREEKIRYDYATQATFNIIWDWSLLTDGIGWNEAIHTQLGHPRKVMSSNGVWWKKHIHPEDRERVIQSIHEVIDSPSDTHWSDEYRFQHADGHYVDVIDRGFVVRNSEGQPIRMIGAMEDRTDLKAKEFALIEKEAQYRSIFESSQDAVMIFDATGILRETNPASSHMHGYTYEEMIGMTGKDFVHPDSLQEFFRFVEDVNAGRRFSVVARHKKKDGTPIDVEVVGSGFTFRGEPALLAVVRDVTERIRTEEALRYQSQITKTITDNAASCLFMMDKKGHPTFMNPAAMEVTGYASLDEIKDKPLHYAVHWKKPDGTYYPMEECPIDNAQAELKHAKDQEEIFCRKDGTLFPVSYSITPLEKDGEVIGSVLEFRDITEIKRAQKELESREAEFRAMANSIPQLAWMAEATGDIFWYNERWYDYTGTVLEDMKGWGWEKVHHPDHLKRVVEFVKEAWKKPEPWELTFPLRSKNGEWRWFLTRGIPLLDKEGHITRWFGTNTDIHEAKTFTEELERARFESESARQTLHNVFMQTSAAVAIWRGPELVFELVNKPYLKVVDRKEEDLLGKTMAEALPEVEKQTIEVIQNIFVTKKPLEMMELPATVIRGGGSDLGYFNLTANPIFNLEGNVERVVIIGYEVTDQVLANRQMEGLTEDLKEALRVRDEFLSIASHELKTPLTSLIMQAQLQKRLIEKDNPIAFERDRVIQLMNQFGRLFGKLNRLIDDMLDISRIRTGRMNIVRERSDVTAIAKDVTDRMREEFIAAGSGAPHFEGEAISALVDPLRIEQVITNLLTNALRYGDGKPIFINIKESGDFVRIEVKDQGRGISQEEQAKIFKRFERAVSSTEISGLGLGLFISEQIVLAHNGRIWVESQLSKGSKFIVELPLNSSDTEAK
jgi:PAS domain S-box-containing protein